MKQHTTPTHINNKSTSQKSTTPKHVHKRNKSARKQDKLWIMLGVIILILLLTYWIFFIAIDFGPGQ